MVFPGGLKLVHVRRVDLRQRNELVAFLVPAVDRPVHVSKFSLRGRWRSTLDGRRLCGTEQDDRKRGAESSAK